ncbi:hypothetical protein CDEST_01189 [Colletotrichum destructivum]|uniref:Uncharacterized protein n=1 Tax=Colletotrichum destructivum TaxID=34406 RepID=A0AAX4HZ04_9PEZI|nr:hypothetical protein CDEST_01189 [Colletotrichum destructivum]
MLKGPLDTPGAIDRLRVGEPEIGVVESIPNLSGHIRSVAPRFERFSVAAAAYVQGLDFENKALRRLLVDKAVEPAVDQTVQVNESLTHTAMKLVE